jgi:hypothetical protein
LPGAGTGDGDRDECSRLSPATQHPLDAASLRKQIGRLWGRPFTLGSLDVSALDADMFLPMSVLNDLRQEAVAGCWR